MSATAGRGRCGYPVDDELDTPFIDIIRFGVLGIGAGGLYALAAIGLVLIHRGSGIVNFAQAAVGLVGAYVYDELRVAGAPLALCLVLGLLASAAVGAAFYLLVVGRMGASSMLAKVVTTLALLVVIDGVVTLRYGPFPRLVPSMLPNGPLTLWGITVGADRLWILLIVLALTGGLWLVYRSTTFGLATSAVAENPRAAAALTVSPEAVACANWAIGSALGGLAAILLVPITGLGSSNITWLVIPVLAAAVIGRFSSFPLTAVGGVAIGIGQSLAVRFVDIAGAGTAVPFAIATVVLLARGVTVVGKNERFGRMPRLGSGRPRPGLIVFGVAVTMACGWWLLPDSWKPALIVQVITAIILLSFVVVTGYTGQISLAQFGFAGLGALGASWLMSHHDWSFLPALFVGGLLTIPVGLVIGLAGVRTRGADLAILTLGFAVALPAAVFANRDIMRHVVGRVRPLQVFGMDVAAREHPERYLTLAVAILVVLALAVANLRRSRAGRRLIAVRTNERAAAALGVSVVGAKLYAFVLGGVIAGIGGALYTFQTTIPSYDFAGLRSVDGLQHAVLGGVGTIGGPLLGSALDPQSLGQRVFVLLNVFGNGARTATIVSILASLLLMVMLVRSPDGLAVLISRWSARLRGRPADDVEALTTPSLAGERISVTAVAPRSLRVDGLTVVFGGVHALDDFSMTVEPGEIVGLIGPNGAGKSTAIEAMTGFNEPQAGRVTLGGAALDGRSREGRARAGLSRSFQSLELFEDLTVLENIQAACDRRDLLAFATNLVVASRDELTPLALEVVEQFGFAGRMTALVDELSYADRRMLAVARAIANGPSVLLLDEPAAGLDTAQTQRLGVILRHLARDRGLAIVLVEHNVDMVLSTCDRVYALDFGRLIAEGTPAEIAADEAVIHSYLGTRRPATA